MKAIYLALAFICLPVFAGYTTMTLEGVQQANGVWTTAGVMDTQGFVRTTGQVSVLGRNTTTAVSLAADVSAVRAASSLAIRAAGPVALAVAAYDIYSYLTTEEDYKPCGDEFCYGDVTLAAPEGPGSCMVFPSYTLLPGYTAEQCKAKNISVFSSYGWTSSFVGWISVQEFPTYYQYAGRYNVPSAGFSETLTFLAPKTTPPSYNGTLVSDAQWNSLGLTIPLIISALNNLPSLSGYKTPFTSTDFTPYSEWYGDSYFKDGNWYRDRMDVSPAPTPSQPTRVRVDIGPIKIEGATNPNIVPDTGPAGGGSAPPKEEPSFCEANPGSIACQEMGEAEQEPLENDDVQFNLDTNQSWGSSNASCPANPTITIHSGQTITFNYQPACDFFSLLRPIIIAFSLLTAVFIAIGRTE